MERIRNEFLVTKKRLHYVDSDQHIHEMETHAVIVCRCELAGSTAHPDKFLNFRHRLAASRRGKRGAFSPRATDLVIFQAI